MLSITTNIFVYIIFSLVVFVGSCFGFQQMSDIRCWDSFFVSWSLWNLDLIEFVPSVVGVPIGKVSFFKFGEWIKLIVSIFRFSKYCLCFPCVCMFVVYFNVNIFCDVRSQKFVLLSSFRPNWSLQILFLLLWYYFGITL